MVVPYLDYKQRDMKRVYFGILVLVALLVSCRTNEVSIALEPATLTLTVGQTAVIDPMIQGTNETVVWTSTDTTVATVWNGIVKARSKGAAVVSATIGKVSAECMVYVVSKPQLPMNVSSRQIEVKKTLQLSVQGEHSQLVWASANPAVASVDQNGLVTGVNDGRTTITATCDEGEAQCVVTVIQPGGSYRGEYVLVWSDEFEGTALDTTQWNIEVTGGGGGNGEKQYYTARSENLRVEDGSLVIEARKENYLGKEYTSARINTKGKNQFAYCKAEARIWLPSGRGTWPAFWMLGTKSGWPSCGEIDIMEHVGSNPTMVSFAVHTQAKNGLLGNNWHSQLTGVEVEGSWHVYGLEWLEYYQYGRDVLRFYVDGKESATIMEPTDTRDIEQWPFFNQSDYNNKFYIILNLALGGSMGGSIDNDIFASPILMKVDWVRVYEKQFVN